MYENGRLSIGNPGTIETVRTMNEIETQFAKTAREDDLEMDKVREYAALHYCITGLNSGEADLDDAFEIEATAGSHMNFETTIEEYLIDRLTPFTSAASQAAETEWKAAWEAHGADSGYSEYVPTPSEKFNWYDVETMALQTGIDEQILLEFLVNLANGMEVSDWTLEWEDATDEHCRTFLIVNPD